MFPEKTGLPNRKTRQCVLNNEDHRAVKHHKKNDSRKSIAAKPQKKVSMISRTSTIIAKLEAWLSMSRISFEKEHTQILQPIEPVSTLESHHHCTWLHYSISLLQLNGSRHSVAPVSD
jgi:hypothetical protein